jgi:hypothetical protein
VSGTRERPRLEPQRRFVPTTLLKPVLCAALGIDGGSLFQILAVEDLGLSPAVIGTAFAFGLLSLPVQVWAARLPLRRARHHLQLFLAVSAAQALFLAWLLGIGATGGLAATALAVTVTAEVAISVLYVPAWQPLLSSRARYADRQRLNAFWPAVARVLLAGAVVVFSAAKVGGRVAILVGLATAAIATAFQLQRLRTPRADGHLSTDPGAALGKTPMQSATRWILASLAFLNLGALPLWLVYVSSVWPGADLGVIGATQTISAVGALLAWRTTDGPIGRRAITGALMTLAGSLSLPAIGHHVESPLQQVAVLAVTAAMAGGMTYASTALLESAHRLVAHGSSVRDFTILDVVDSSSLQLGLFIGGLLVSVSAVETSWTPYVVFVIATTLVATAVIWRTTRLVPRQGPHPAHGRTSS